MFKEIKAKEIFAFLAMFLGSISAIFFFLKMSEIFFSFFWLNQKATIMKLPQGFSVADPFLVDMLYY